MVPQHVPLRGAQEAHQAGIRVLISHHGGANLLQGKAAEQVSKELQHSSSKSFTGKGITVSHLPVPGEDLGGFAPGGPPAA